METPVEELPVHFWVARDRQSLAPKIPSGIVDSLEF